MTMLEYEIESFGRRLGLESLKLSSEGLARLDIENVGSLYLERGKDGELLVYISSSLPDHDVEAVRRLLSLCDYRRALPMPLQAGAFSGRAVLLTRMDENTVTAAALENALRFLSELLHDAVRAQA